MLLAGDRMSNTSDSISEIAQSLGYQSASAFTKAFRACNKTFLLRSSRSGLEHIVVAWNMPVTRTELSWLILFFPLSCGI
jgi:hypothetical protein